MAAHLSPSVTHKNADPALAAKFDAQAFVLRKTDPSSGGMLVGGSDAFAQIFASTQESRDVRSAPTDPKSDDSHSGPITAKPRQSLQAKDDNGQQDSDETRAADASDDAAAKADAADDAAKAKHAEKKSRKHTCEAKTDDVKASDATVTTAKTQVAKTDDTAVVKADTAEAPVDPQTVADNAQNTTPTNPAFCISPMLKAQEEAAATSPTKGDKDGEEQDTGSDNAALDNLLSFRPSPKTGDAETGKNGTPVKATGDAKGDFKAELNAKNGAPVDPQAKPEDTTGDAKSDLASMLTRTTPGEKIHHEQQTENSRGVAPAAENVAAKADAPVSPTPPAAGSRVNAQTGFPAPTPTGSGSGSPPSEVKAAANGVEGIGAMGAAAGTQNLQNGGPVQLTKAAARAAATTPAEQVTVGITRALKNGNSSFEVQLSPENMGKVEIKLDISKDGLVRAVVTTDNQATHDMLQKDSSALEKVFQQAGLQTDAGSLSFNLRDQAQQQQTAQQQGDAPASWKRWMGNPANTEQVEAAQPEYYTVANGRVDLRI